MSACIFIAADIPLEEVKNPHYKQLSINQAKELGMEIDEMFLEDIDPDEPEVILWSDIEEIYEDDKLIREDFDDDFSLLEMDYDLKKYSNKKFGVYIEWSFPTNSKAQNVAKYIQKILEETDNVEIWCVWLSESKPPLIKTTTIKSDELEAKHIMVLANADIWNNTDDEVPTYYCLNVIA